MCNAFNTAKNPDKGRLEFPSEPKETRLIRRTDEAPVVMPSGELVEMRWGFRRKNLGVVNNTRSDNLESPMWREAIAERRCLVPVVSYYEWTGPKGGKETHLFRSPREEWLWAAGIWEETAELGRCFSMLTTEANELVKPIHHRMPALLTKEEQEVFLKEGLERFAPAPGILVTERAANPLVKPAKKKAGPIQGDLFESD